MCKTVIVVLAVMLAVAIAIAVALFGVARDMILCCRNLTEAIVNAERNSMAGSCRPGTGAHAHNNTKPTINAKEK